MVEEKYTVVIEGDSSDLQTSLKGAAKSFGKLEVSMQDLKVAGAASLAAITGAAVVSVKAFAKFDNELRGVKTLLDKNSFGAKGLEKGFADLTKGVVDLGKRVPVDIGAMNKALFDTISAGVDAGKAVEVLETSAKLAVAGLTDVSIATDGMTSALNAYNLNASEAEEVASKFFAAQKAGKTTIAELASGFGLVGASANAAGVSLDELLAATSAVTTAGVATSAAYTGLKAVLGNIAKPTAEAAKEAKRLGVEFNAAALRSQGLKGFLDTLTNSQNFNADSLSKLFGSLEAHKIATSLAGTQSESFASTLETLADKQGSLNVLTGAYKTQSESLQNQMKLAENQANLLSIKLGEALAPQVLLVTKYWTEFLEGLGKEEGVDSLKEVNKEIAELETKLSDMKNESALSKLFKAAAFGAETVKARTVEMIDLEQELLALKERQAAIIEQESGEGTPGEDSPDDAAAKVTEIEAAKTAALLAAKATRAAEVAAMEEEEFNQAMMNASDRGEELSAEQLRVIQDKLDKEKFAKDFAKADELKKQGKHDKALAVLQGIRDKKDIAASKAKAALESQVNQQRISIAQNTAALITTIAGKENKAAFVIAQAAAAAQVAVGTAKALAMVPAQTAHLPFPTNLAPAAKMTSLIYANAGIQAATIAAATIQGFAQGGEVTGGIPGKDSVPIMAQRREIIAPAKNYDELIESVARSRGFTQDDDESGDMTLNINFSPEGIVEGIVEPVVFRKRATGEATI